MSAAPVVIQRTLAPEDQARADFYAILGRLFAAPPDAELLRVLAQSERLAESDANPVTRSWNRLLDASGVMPAAAAAQEYTDLFIGVGRSEINLHGSHWLTGFMLEYYPEGAAPIVRAEAVNTATTYGYDTVTMMQETKTTLCQVAKS